MLSNDSPKAGLSADLLLLFCTGSLDSIELTLNLPDSSSVTVISLSSCSFCSSVRL